MFWIPFSTCNMFFVEKQEKYLLLLGEESNNNKNKDTFPIELCH